MSLQSLRLRTHRRYQARLSTLFRADGVHVHRRSVPLTNYLGDRSSRGDDPKDTSISPRCRPFTQPVSSLIECQIDSGHERHPSMNRVVVQESPNPTCLEVGAIRTLVLTKVFLGNLLDHRRPRLCIV